MSVALEYYREDRLPACYLTSVTRNEYTEVIKWLQENFGPERGRWKEIIGCFIFESEEDQTLFLLRWS